MTDTWSVTAAYDKPSYNKGDTMKISISGKDVLTATSSAQGGSVTLTIKAADGATTTVVLNPTSISTTTSTDESVSITGVADSSGRVWTVDVGGLFATATA